LGPGARRYSESNVPLPDDISVGGDSGSSFPAFDTLGMAVVIPNPLVFGQIL